MRGVKISVPVAKAQEVKDLAFRHDILELSTSRVEHIRYDGKVSEKETIEIETSTPVAKRFTESFLNAPFFDQRDCFISTRQRRSIVSVEGLSQLTWPWAEPGVDIVEELWQFSHLTTSLVLRTLIAGGLLAFGVINQRLLFIISGILFLPALPIVLAMGFSMWLRQWRLTYTSMMTFAVVIILLLISGSGVAALSNGPVKFDEFVSLPVSMTISIAVGVAAALASTDDVGRRELIGLAATAQIAIIPVWIGACLVLGVPASSPEGEMQTRIANIAINIVLLAVSSTVTYILIGATTPAIKKLKS